MEVLPKVVISRFSSTAIRLRSAISLIDLSLGDSDDRLIATGASLARVLRRTLLRMLQLGSSELSTSGIAAWLSLVILIDDFRWFEELAILMLFQRGQELLSLIYRAIQCEGALLEVQGLHVLQFEPV